MTWDEETLMCSGCSGDISLRFCHRCGFEDDTGWTLEKIEKLVADNKKLRAKVRELTYHD